MAADWTLWPALTTCLALLVYFLMGLQVGTARGKHGVKAPAVSGHPDFERIFRAHMNTLEWMPLFLPLLWMAAYFTDARIASAVGLVWIAGRYLYFSGYAEAAEKRSTGFAVQALAILVLFLMTVAGALLGLFQIRLF